MAPTQHNKANADTTKDSKTLAEKELTVYCSMKVMEYLRLASVENGDKFVFEVWVKLKSEKFERQLITHNKKTARQWKSLDRAVKHIREIYIYCGRVYLDI